MSTSSNKNLKLASFLPRNLKNPMAVSLIKNLFDRFLTKDDSTPVLGWVGDNLPGSLFINQPNFERSINSLEPLLYTQHGAQQFATSFNDVVNKLSLLDVDTDNLASWAQDQQFNFAPPINYDKFVNFSRYRWIGNAIKHHQTPDYNPKMNPEYYVIALPVSDIQRKIPVKCATPTPNGAITLAGSQTIDGITVVNGDRVLVKGQANLVDNGIYVVSAYTVDNPPQVILTGNVNIAVNGAQIASNTVATVDPVTGLITGIVMPTNLGLGYATPPTVSFFGGTAGGATATAQIDSVTGAITGFTITNPGAAWSRSLDFDDQNLTFDINGNPIKQVITGSLITVIEGLTQGPFWQMTSVNPVVGTDPIEFVSVSTDNGLYNNPPAITDWAATNYWVHELDVAVLGLDINSTSQALRPIIEYDNDLELNNIIGPDGTPLVPSQFNHVPGAVVYQQTKSEFNQLPMFNLYTLDNTGNTTEIFTARPSNSDPNPVGAPANLVSSIFYYTESPNYPTDSVIQRRISSPSASTGDYVFEQGLIGENGRMYFFKKGDLISSIWVPGEFSGPTWERALVNGGTVVVPGGPAGDAQTVQQVTVAIPATGITNATLSGLYPLPDGTNLITGNTVLVTAQLDPTQNGVYVVSTGAWSKSVSYMQATSGQVFEVMQGSNVGTYWSMITPTFFAQIDFTQSGAWTVPPQMFYNLEHENRAQVNFADIQIHLSSIIAAQTGFSGSAFGDNNFRQLTSVNHGLGGTIIDFNSSFDLFMGLMNQQDISPLSIIDFAQSSYAQAINDAIEYLNIELVSLISNGSVSPISTINPADPGVLNLLKVYETYVSAAAPYINNYSDTTSPISGFPVTLPYIGFPATKPSYKFDNELGVFVIQHHDGHETPAIVIDDQTVQRLVNAPILRSDGKTTTGTFSASTSVPVLPYRNQLWYVLGATPMLKQFSVLSDTSVFAADIGANAGKAAASTYIDINPKATAATILTVTQNAATAAISAAVNALQTGDLWFNRSNGTLNSWDAPSNSWINLGNTPVVISQAFKVLDLTDLYNSFLLALELQLYNGIPSYQPLVWDQFQYANSPARLNELLTFAATNNVDPFGTDFNATDPFTWNYTNANYTGHVAVEIGTDPGYARWFTIYENFFGTARPNLEPWILTGDTQAAFMTMWPAASSFGTTAMWNYVRSKWTGPLGVNTTTNQLLPPYLSTLDPNASDAVLNAIPSGINAKYVLGDMGPVELAWSKSINYYYGLARISFELDPINFVHQTWGTNWVSVNGYLLDRASSTKPAQSSLTIHGELIKNLVTRNPSTLFSSTPVITSSIDITWTFVAATSLPSGAAFLGSDTENGSVAPAITGTPYNIGAIQFTITDGGLDFNIGDKITIAWTAATSTYDVSFTPATYKKVNGLNQVYAQLMRYDSLDTSISINTSLLRDWTVNLGYRVGGFLNTDTLQLKSDKYTIHTTDYNALLKTNPYVLDSWVEGLRIQVVQLGGSSLTNGIYKPTGDASDWVFRIQIANDSNPSLPYYTLNTSSDFLTFKALDGTNCPLVWNHYLQPEILSTAPMPMTITGLQNVINFVYGYTISLANDGWQFNSSQNPQIDAATGRTQGWQLEIEKFIDKIYQGIQLGSGVILNPFISKVWISTPTGLPSEFKGGQNIDLRTTPCIMDILGNVIPTDKFRVLRNDDVTEIVSDIPISSAHYLLETLEHVIVFQDYSADQISSNLIYDPFLGIRVQRIYIDGKRQSTFNGRPQFGGHFLNSAGFSENIEASVVKMQNYYDTSEISGSTSTATAAQRLVGYTQKPYFNNIDTPNTSQFNFWKGMIHNKGSNLSVDAFINSTNFQSTSIDESWAYKLASYGDARQKTFPEIKIETADSRYNFTVLRFLEYAETVNASAAGEILITPTDQSRWFSIDDLGTIMYFQAELVTTLTGTGIIGDIVDLPVISDAISGATLINSTTAQLTATGPYSIACYAPAAPNFSPAKLLDYAQPAILANIPIWDPARGVHQVNALEIIDVINDVNPAKYNTTTQTVNNHAYDPLRPWGADQVGTIWWDTTNRAYLNYSDATLYPMVDDRLNRWGSLAAWGSIDVYQWVSSSVPPSKWAALAASQIGNADIPNDQKASGTPALQQVFTSTRQWQERTVAWKYAPYPPGGANFLAGTGQQRMILSSSNEGPQIAILNVDRFSTFGIVAGTSMSAFDYTVTQLPIGLGSFTGSVYWYIGQEDPAQWQNTLVATPTSFDSIQVKGSATGKLGTAIGPIIMSTSTVNAVVYVTATSLLTSVSQSIAITSAVTAGTLVSLDFNTLGIMLYGVAQTDVSIATIASDFGNFANDIYVREAFSFNIDIPFPSETVVLANPGMSNDPDDLLTYGFAVWQDPTPAELAADLPAPNNRWQPIVGLYTDVAFTPQLLERIKADAAAPLILPTGIQEQKFSFEWSAWTKLETVRTDSKVTSTSPTWTITLPSTVPLDTTTGEIVPATLNVYLNGLAVPSSAYSADGLVITYNSELPIGSLLTVIVTAYQPTATELAFNPAVKDNVAIDTQYLIDYEYVTQQTRDSGGAIGSPIYYFWVQNATFAVGDNAMSIENATSLLANNTEPYLVLQDYKPASYTYVLAPGITTTDFDASLAGYDVSNIDYDDFGYDLGPDLALGPLLPNRYATAAIYGLTTQVTEDNTYKIRFTQDFTLRKDPNGIDLKNVHTEWTLIRPAMANRIPAQLWNIMTNAVCGQDSAGNLVPSLNRIDYDNANGTLTQYGFGSDQAFVKQALAIKTITYTILNTALTITLPGTSVAVPDVITALNFAESSQWFANPIASRQTLTTIWNQATPTQINEIFFAVLQDALTTNYEFTDMFKTSILSAYSVRVSQTAATS